MSLGSFGVARFIRGAPRCRSETLGSFEGCRGFVGFIGGRSIHSAEPRGCSVQSGGT